MAPLVTFLQEHAGRPFAWGSDDCCLFLADWWGVRHGIDPARHLRGTYSDRPPGVMRRVLECIRIAGAVETASPTVGDIALVRVDGALIGAIRTESGWAIRAISGVGFIPPVKAVRAWSV